MIPENYQLTEKKIREALNKARTSYSLDRGHKRLEDFETEYLLAAGEKAAREALKDVGEELEKPCPHHHFMPGIKRRDCGTCVRQLSEVLRFGSQSSQPPASLGEEK